MDMPFALNLEGAQVISMRAIGQFRCEHESAVNIEIIEHFIA